MKTEQVNKSSIFYHFNAKEWVLIYQALNYYVVILEGRVKNYNEVLANTSKNDDMYYLFEKDRQNAQEEIKKIEELIIKLNENK